MPVPPCKKDLNQNIGSIDFAEKVIKYYNCDRVIQLISFSFA